jgi:hypothetical protein
MFSKALLSKGEAVKQLICWLTVETAYCYGIHTERRVSFGDTTHTLEIPGEKQIDGHKKTDQTAVLLKEDGEAEH